jgi:hypothetical protein
MTAEVEPRDGLEALMLTLYRQMPAREQQAFYESSLDDGRSLVERMIDFGIACGDSPAVARQKASDALATKCQRALLNRTTGCKRVR